jgi:phage-related minor tail protein
MKIILFLTLSWLAFMVSPVKASETVNGAKKDLAEFRDDMKVRLQVLDGEITEAKEKAKVTGSRVQQKTLVELEKTRDKIRVDLEKLGQTTGGNWRKLKLKVADSVDNLNNRVQALLKPTSAEPASK